MKTLNTECGKVCIGGRREIFDEAIALAVRHRRENKLIELIWALSGDATAEEAERLRPIAEYAGEYEHPGYGTLSITEQDAINRWFCLMTGSIRSSSSQS